MSGDIPIRLQATAVPPCAQRVRVVLDVIVQTDIHGPCARVLVQGVFGEGEPLPPQPQAARWRNVVDVFAGYDMHGVSAFRIDLDPELADAQ